MKNKVNNKKKRYYIYSLDMKFLNIFSFIILFLIIGLTCLIDKDFLIEAIEYVFYPDRLLYAFVFIFLYLALHEILHSMGYYLYGAKYKNIIYGIELEKGIFYCLCKQNVNKKNIMNSLLFPLFYIGIVTYIMGIFCNNYYLLVLSIFNISGCVGDIFTFLFMLKLDMDIEFSEFDDTTSFAIYTDKDIGKNKYLGLNFKEVRDSLDRYEYKKVRISKCSYIILLIIFVFLGFTMFK